MTPSSSIIGACLEHPDRSGTPCTRCGTFRCGPCLTAGLCEPCRSNSPLRPPVAEDTVGFGPRVGGRVIDFVVGFIAGLGGGVIAGIVLMVFQLMGVVSAGWASRLQHGFGFNMLSGLTAGLVGATLCTWVCGASLGKLMLGLRVVETTGQRVSLKGAFVRELGYLVDAFFFGLVGKAAMDGSELQQRHGDRWAETVVVRRDRVSPDAVVSSGRLAGGVLLGFVAHMLVLSAFFVVAAM